MPDETPAKAEPAEETPAAEIERVATQLVDALLELRIDPDNLPQTNELRSTWHDLGAVWAVEWARSLGRDLANAAGALERAKAAGATEDGATELENALWRADALFEKFQDVIALGLGVPALKLSTDQKRIWRFESDRKKNRKRLHELAAERPIAKELLEVDVLIASHRFLKIRHALTHSLAPILGWQSLTRYELAEIDEKGGVLFYVPYHLTPDDEIQGATAPEELFPRTLADGREFVALAVRAIEFLSDLLTFVGTPRRRRCSGACDRPARCSSIGRKRRRRHAMPAGTSRSSSAGRRTRRVRRSSAGRRVAVGRSKTRSGKAHGPIPHHASASADRDSRTPRRGARRR
jgi:hypothetical protein